MADKRGWWSLDVGDVELSECDREHIANCILNGYIGGEICKEDDITDRWVFERSSGYAGYRCNVCMTWVYADAKKVCECDRLIKYDE